jgi:membrane protein implicated in regulation of membrane protease activity
MNSLGPFQFVIILILAILLIGLARYLTKKLEKNIVLTRATQTGEEIETMATMAKARLKN